MPRQTKEWKAEGQKDRQTLFYRTLPATAGVPKISANMEVDLILH